jgi:heme exporter protein C
MKTRILGFVALAAVAVMTAVALFVVPADLNQGDAQRIMYPHVASAWLAYLSFGVTAVAGLLWLWKRDLRYDAVAVAGAEIGVMFTAFAIWGGMMWGRPIWGVYWQWEDPRLTTTALLLALYVGYLLFRRLTDDPERRATRAAIVGIVAAVDIPIVHFSVEWWRGLHQTATIGSPERVLNPAAPMAFVGTLLGTLGAFTLTWLYLMIRRYQLGRAELVREEAVRVGRLREARAAVPASGGGSTEGVR